MSIKTHVQADFSARLAQWVATTSRGHSVESIRAADRAIVDTVACMVAGMNDEAVVRVQKGVSLLLSDGGIVGNNERHIPDAPWAALILGTAAHALDYDDVLDPAASHVSAVLIPALLALSQDISVSGAALVDAYIIGVQVQMLLAESVNMSHYTQGWHTTLTLGAPAAAAACARLLSLDTTSCLHALSIASSLSGGFKRQFGTNTKPFHAGLAAKNGLIAARMAQAGLTADHAPFEGERGFRDLMAGSESAGFTYALKELEAQSHAPVPSIWQKRYPCCASTHRAVDAVLALMHNHQISPGEITRIETVVSAAAVGNLMYTHPENVMQARFSMPYCLAAAALDGDLTLATFTAEALSHKELISFLPRVTMTADPAQPRDMPATQKSWATVKIVTHTDSFSMRVIDPKGYPQHPLTESELKTKFSDCVSYAGVTQTPAAYSHWRNFSREPDASRYYQALLGQMEELFTGVGRSHPSKDRHRCF